MSFLKCIVCQPWTILQQQNKTKKQIDMIFFYFLEQLPRDTSFTKTFFDEGGDMYAFMT